MLMMNTKSSKLQKLQKGLQMKKSLIAFLMLATTSYTLASSSTVVTKITKVYTYGTVAVFALANQTGDSEGCSNSRYTVINLQANGGKALYSAALTAFTTNTNVRFGVNGCYAWSGTIPITYRLELQK